MIEDDDKLEVIDNRITDPFATTEPRAKLFPTRSRATVDLEPDASYFELVAANFKRGTSVGGMLYGQSTEPFDPSNVDGFNFVSYIPDDLIDYPDVFATCTSEESIKRRAEQLRKELNDKEKMAKNPIKSFFAGIPAQMADPINYIIPGNVYYNSIKRGSNIMRSAISGALGGAGSAAVQEGILQERELSRQADESMWNIFSAAAFGATIGTVSGAFAKKKMPFFKEQMINELTDKPSNLTKNGLISENTIAKLPPGVQKGMRITPLQRLITSDFESSKGLASQLFEHNWDLVKNYEGKTDGQSIETHIKIDKREAAKAMLDYQDVYFQSRGIGEGPFRGTRDKLFGIGRTIDEYNAEVARVIITGIESSDEHIMRGAKILEEKIFNPMRDRAVALDLLPEGVTPKNAASYFMTVYNKQKIIEEGGNQVTSPFYQKLLDEYTVVNEEIKAWKESPVYNQAQQKIKDNEQLLKKMTATERNEIDKQIKTLAKEMKELEQGAREVAPEKIAKVKTSVDASKSSIKKATEYSGRKVKEMQVSIKSENTKLNKALADADKEIAKINKDASRYKTKVQQLRTRREVLKARANNAPAGSAAKEKAVKELNTINSAIIEVEKNVKSINETIKPFKDKKAEAKKVTAEKIKQIKEKIEAENKDLKERIARTERQIKEYESTLVPDKEKIEAAKKKIAENKAKIKNLEKSKKAPYKKELQALRDEIKQIEADLLKKTPARYKNSKGELRSVSTTEQLNAAVSQTIDNILGRQEGVMLNPVLDMLERSGGKPLKERVMSVDQAKLMEWTVNDPMKIADMYMRAMAPVINMAEAAKKNGHASVNDWMLAIEKSMKEELDIKSKGLTGKAASKLNEKFKSDLKDIKASFQLLKGVYGDGPNVLSNKAANFYRNFMMWNAMRLLGFMTISSFADIGHIMMKNGVWRTIQEGIIPVFKSFFDPDIATRDLKALGFAIETELGTRIKAFAEHEGLQTNPGPFQRAFDEFSQKFGNITLMNQWNDTMQNITGHVVINRILDGAATLKEKGKLATKERKKLASMGLSEQDLLIIAEKTAGQIDEKTGARYSDWANWEINSDAEAQALRNFKGALSQEIDSTVVLPGLGDKPLIGQTKLGKALFQFKSFMFASTNKVFLSGLQNLHELQTWTGLAAMLSLGALSYITTCALRGEEPDYSTGNFVTEVIDRSGALGVLMEVYNISNKAGLIPGNGVSRYKSRDIVGAFTGPSGGLISEIAGILGKLNYSMSEDKRLTTKDAEKLMRLAPLQNLFYLYYLNRKVTRNAALNLGFEDKG